MGHEQALSDTELVRHALAGRKEDFGVLVRRYLPALRTLAYSKTGNQADAEEITQEAFLKGFKYLDRLKEPARFGAWMAAIVRNVALTFLKKRTQAPGVIQDIAASSCSVERDIEGRDLRRFLREKIGELDEIHRDVLLLYYFAGLNTRQIAELLSLSTDAVQKRLQRAREVLGNSILAGLKAELGFEAPTEKHAARVMGIVAAMPVPWLGQGAGASATVVSILPKATAVNAMAANATVSASVVTKGAVATLMLAAALSVVWVFAHDSDPSRTRVVEASPSVAAGEEDSDQALLPAEGLLRASESLPASEAVDETQSAEDEVQEVRLDPTLAPRSIAPLGYPGTTAPDDMTDTVAGIVYDPSGAPLPEAKVWVARFAMNAPDTRETQSDGDGKFAFRLPPGQWMLQARKGLFGGEANTGFAGQFITHGKGRTIEARVPTERWGKVHGRVRDKATGKPIPHARIRTDNRAWIEADAEGRYAIEGIRPKDHTMMVLAPGYKREYVLYCNLLREEHEVDLFLVPGRKVTGTVLEASGRPLAHAWVRMPRSGSGCLGGDYDVCDENGRFEYDGLPLGKRVRLRASVPLYTNVCDASYEHIEGRTHCAIELERADSVGEPLEVAFVLDPLIQEEVRQVREWDRRPPEALVCGRVVGPLGSPVRNFRVLLQVPHTPVDGWMSMEINESHRGYTFTGNEGVFCVTSDSMVPGSITRVVAIADGCGEAASDLTTAHALRNPPSPEVLVLQLSGANEFSVRVREAGGGRQPVAGASVSVLDWTYSHGQSFPWSEHYEGGLRTSSVRTDDQGWARFEDLPFNEGVVTARKEGLGSRHVTWAVGESVVSVELAPECVIEGKACDRDGNPLETGSVFLRTGGNEPYDYYNPNHDRFSHSLERGSGGRFCFSGLPPGDYELRVSWREEESSPLGDSIQERGYEDAFTLDPGQSLTVSYPEDSFSANPDRWMGTAAASDEALKSRLLGTWTREWQLDVRRTREVFHFAAGGRFKYAGYGEGAGHPSEQAGVFQVVNGELHCLTDSGQQQNWSRIEMPDADTLDFPDLPSSHLPSWQRAASLEEATRLGQHLAALPDPRPVRAGPKASPGSFRRRATYGGMR